MDSLRWHGTNDTLEIGPFKLKGPMVYSTQGRDLDEPSAIHPALPIREAKGKNKYQDEFDLSYFFQKPQYAQLKPSERWAYLQWLDQGRPHTNKMVFLGLYLQGLERRVFLERNDLFDIWQEIWRLYPTPDAHWHPLYHCMDELLWGLLLFLGSEAPPEHVIPMACEIGQYHTWDEETAERFALLLSWGVNSFQLFPPWLAFEVARILLPRAPGVVYERAAPQMMELFVARLSKRNPRELEFQPSPQPNSTFHYSPLNVSLPEISIRWHDAFEDTDQWSKSAKNWIKLFEECVEELRPFARVLGQGGASPASRLAWEALPPELRQGQHPCREKLWQLGEGQWEETGCLTTVAQVAQILEIAPRPALTPQLGKGLVLSLHMCGLSVEPDVRLSSKPYRWDDAMALFPASADKEDILNDAAIARYQSHVAFLRCGLFVAQAAGQVPQDMLALITQRLFEAFDLRPMEKRRAEVAARLMTQEKIALTGHKWPEQEMETLKARLPALLLEVTGHGGQVNTAQEKALAAVWKRLGLEKQGLTQKLDQLSARGVMFIRSGTPGRPGEKLLSPPPDASPAAPLELDHNVIGTLLEDTAHVHQALSEAMNGEEDGIQNAPGVTTSATEPVVLGETVSGAAPTAEPEEDKLNGLPPQLEGLLAALLQQPQWELAQAQELARRHDIMLAGAIEKINDWAFEELGEQLIYDDGNVLSVEQESTPLIYRK